MQDLKLNKFIIFFISITIGGNLTNIYGVLFMLQGKTVKLPILFRLGRSGIKSYSSIAGKANTLIAAGKIEADYY